MIKRVLLIAALAGLSAAALTLGPMATAHARSPGCLLCVWRDITAGARTAIIVVTSLGAIGGAIGAAAGEQIGGSFGRGFGRSLGEKAGSGELLSLATGGAGVIAGTSGLVDLAIGDLEGKIKGGIQDKTLDWLLGEDKASREQEALDWLQQQVSG